MSEEHYKGPFRDGQPQPATKGRQQKDFRPADVVPASTMPKGEKPGFFRGARVVRSR